MLSTCALVSSQSYYYNQPISIAVIPKRQAFLANGHLGRENRLMNPGWPIK